MVHILEHAATFEGGLDRGNIALAARFIDAQNPIVLDGIVQQTNGFQDAYLNEGGRMADYTVETRRAGHVRPGGELLDNNGGSATTTTSSEAQAADALTTQTGRPATRRASRSPFLTLLAPAQRSELRRTCGGPWNMIVM